MRNPVYVGFWSRVGSAILDLIILGIPALIVGGALWWVTHLKAMYYLAEIALLCVTVYMDGMKGGTPGKLVLNMRIVNETGNYIGIPNAILRYLSKLLSAIILLIGYFMIGWDTRKQGLHDKIAKTFVVRNT